MQDPFLCIADQLVALHAVNEGIPDVKAHKYQKEHRHTLDDCHANLPRSCYREDSRLQISSKKPAYRLSYVQVVFQAEKTGLPWSSPHSSRSGLAVGGLSCDS